MNAPSYGRRDFVVRTAAGLTALLLPLGACAAVAVARVAPVDGALRLRPGEHPSLARPGGHVRLLNEAEGTFIDVLAVDGGYVALSPICTHLGCTVAVEGPRLVCPCHGSTYGRDGAVLRGPAERALRTFPVRVEPDGTVAISVGGAR